MGLMPPRSVPAIYPRIKGLLLAEPGLPGAIEPGEEDSIETAEHDADDEPHIHASREGDLLLSSTVQVVDKPTTADKHGENEVCVEVPRFTCRWSHGYDRFHWVLFWPFRTAARLSS